jgi:signal transduction histidine kinase
MDSLRILLVDDDEVDRLSVKRLFRQAGIDADIRECAERSTALVAARSGEFDCMLLDYRLPGTDGVELLRELNNSGVSLPVVALTGQGDEEVAVALMKAGAADYLNKNALSAERLERSLRYAVALHRAEEERRQLLEREHQARLEAQAANRAKDEFLATLSHELRTPLNAIMGWSRLLASGHLDEATSRRAIEIIERNTRHQAQLIEDLLDISRIVTGKLRLEFRAVPLKNICEAVLDSLRPTAEACHVTLTYDHDESNEAILCDPARMQQIIWNLLSNAIKFTPEGGVVGLSVARTHESVAVTVRDTGTGIDPDFLPHVFDRFRQQDPATTRRHGGLGLGLSIVRHLVELHGGTITAASDGRGQGATFTVTLPIAPARANEIVMIHSQEEIHLAGLPSLAGIRVLVVDNEADARALIAAVLERWGAEVATVASVAEAMERIQHARPDVLLSDIAMPGEDGYDLIRQVRALDVGAEAPLPAAALTAFANANDRARALLAGYQAHLPKPIEAAELGAVVAALAGRTVKGVR